MMNRDEHDETPGRHRRLHRGSLRPARRGARSRAAGFAAMPGCPRSTSPRTREGSCNSLPSWLARGAYWRSGRSAVTAPSTSPAPCPRTETLISLELEERHAEVARANIERAGLADRVEVRVGDARELLAAMAENGEEPFDLIFIDADKEGYPEYLDWSLRLSRPGSLILGGQHHPRRERARPPGRICAGHAGVQRAGGRRSHGSRLSCCP